MEDSVLKLSFDIPMLTLQDLSTIKVATTLWNNPEFLNLIMECDSPDEFSYRLHTRGEEQWETVQVTAKKLISNICNSTALQASINELLWPVTYRILLWKSTYALGIDNKFLRHFYWTDRGKIDNVRTARYIIGNKKISIRRRFILACSMCLSKEIQEIWEEMSKKDKFYFCSENREKMCPLLVFWAHTLEGQDNVLKKYLEDAIECATFLGLLEAVKYLFNLLIANAKSNMALFYLDHLNDNVIGTNFLEEYEIEIGFFLLSQMNSESQQRVLNSHYIYTLPLFIHSSNRKHFLKGLVERFKSASACEVDILLRLLFNMYHFELSKDCIYRELFINAWQTIPNPMRSYAVSNLDTGLYCLCSLIRDNFSFLLKEGAFEKLTELTSPDFKPSTSIKQFDFNQDRWEFLLFLIKEEVATLPSLRENSDLCMRLLRIKKSNKTCWDKLLIIISEIGSKNKQQEG